MIKNIVINAQEKQTKDGKKFLIYSARKQTERKFQLSSVVKLK